MISSQKGLIPAGDLPGGKGSDRDWWRAGLPDMVGEQGPVWTGGLLKTDDCRPDRGCKGRRRRWQGGQLMLGNTGGRAIERGGLVRVSIVVLRQWLAYRPAIKGRIADGVEVALQAGGLMQWQQQGQHIEGQHRDGDAGFAEHDLRCALVLAVHESLVSPSLAPAQVHWRGKVLSTLSQRKRGCF